MKAAFVSDESNRNNNKHHNEYDTLFVFRELENSKQALHRSVKQLSLLNSRTPLSSLGLLWIVILSEAKNLSDSFLRAHRANSQRCFTSLNMTRMAYVA
jgi:hypothetical protein